MCIYYYIRCDSYEKDHEEHHPIGRKCKGITCEDEEEECLRNSRLCEPRVEIKLNMPKYPEYLERCMYNVDMIVEPEYIEKYYAYRSEAFRVLENKLAELTPGIGYYCFED